MRRQLVIGGYLLLVFLAGACNALANDVTTDIMSAYVWRGQVLNDEAVLQPGFTLETPIGVVLNTWGNMDMTDKNDESWEFNEVDLTIGYAVPMPEESMVGVEIGVIEYLFPKEGKWDSGAPDTPAHAEVATKGHDDDTRELYAAVEIDTLLAPSVSVYYDCDEINGWYITAGVAQGFDLVEGLAAEIGASIGWASDRYNKAYFGVDDSLFNDCNVAASLAYAVTEEIGIGATAAYTFLLDSKIKDGAEDSYGDKDLFYGGLNLAYTF